MTPIIAESLAKLIIDAKEILHFERVEFSPTGGDLIGIYQDSIAKSIEVKSTGNKAFQYFSEKDLNADFIVWVHFDDYFQAENEIINVYVITVPREEWDTKLPLTRKISLNALLTRLNMGEHYKKYVIELGEDNFNVN